MPKFRYLCTEGFLYRSNEVKTAPSPPAAQSLWNTSLKQGCQVDLMEDSIQVPCISQLLPQECCIINHPSKQPPFIHSLGLLHIFLILVGPAVYLEQSFCGRSNRDRHNHTSKCQASNCITSANIPSAKASRMAMPKIERVKSFHF